MDTPESGGSRYLRAWFFALLIGCSLPPSADDAAVLPAGVSRIYWDFYHYQTTRQRYNADGEREDLAFPFTDAALDSSVIESLQPLDALVGSASLGNVSVDFEYEIDVLDIGFAYGLTDRLSIGFHLPYYWITNHVDTGLDSSSANVGLNPATGECCIPIGLGGTPLDQDDVQQLIVDEYGFSRIDTWDRDGIADLEFGGKYQWFLERDSALAITGGVRLATGYEDDADKLDDVAWSYGHDALLLRLHYDFLLSNAWQEIPARLHDLNPDAGELLLNLTFRLDYLLPDRRTMRFGDSPSQIFSNDRERVERDMGEIYSFETTLAYQVTDAWACALTYTYTTKSKDDIDGDRGFNYASLEADTDFSHHIYIIEANYSTLAAYRRQQSAVPLRFSIAYRDRFRGKGPFSGQANSVLDTSWIVVGMEFLL